MVLTVMVFTCCNLVATFVQLPVLAHTLRILPAMSYSNLRNPDPTSVQSRKHSYTRILRCVAFLPLLACGGSPKTSHYEQAMSKQEACCQALADDQQRAACAQSIVRIDDASIEDSEVNEASFRCIEKNFVCNPATGQATQEASQAALDCITDL